MILYTIIFLLLLHFAHIVKQKIYWRRINKWHQALGLAEHQKNFTTLYQDINGFDLSIKARKKQDAPEYVYGEIEFISFIALLSLAKPDSSTIFYDLGSGIGRAIIACSMVFDIKKCCGIELFSPLHEAACLQASKLLLLPGYEEKANRIHFMQGDFLMKDWQEASLFFINATAFFGETWQKINHKLDILSNPSVTVITTSKPLHAKQFFLIKKTAVQMSWGIVQAYIHKKIESPSQNTLC